ncbi:hypothetical protein AAY473_001258 [Plecturocebus cupreus]
MEKVSTMREESAEFDLLLLCHVSKRHSRVPGIPKSSPFPVSPPFILLLCSVLSSGWGREHSDTEEIPGVFKKDPVRTQGEDAAYEPRGEASGEAQANFTKGSQGPLCCPGWIAAVQSQLTAASTSWAQAILLPQPPQSLGPQRRGFSILPRLDFLSDPHGPVSSGLLLPLSKSISVWRSLTMPLTRLLLNPLLLSCPPDNPCSTRKEDALNENYTQLLSYFQQSHSTALHPVKSPLSTLVPTAPPAPNLNLSTQEDPP